MIDDKQVLQIGFTQFVKVARELEQSYAALKERAAAVDLQLQASNRALQQSLAEREAMFSALPIGLLALRDDGEIGSSNVEADRLVAAAEAAGIDLLRRREGEVRFGDVAVRVRRVPLPDGELVLLEDRSRLQALEQEVRRLDRLAGLSELALGVAHEVKNPLNGVLGFANLIERSNDPEAMKRFAGRIAEGVRAIDDIVKALLGFARPADKPACVASLARVVERAATDLNMPRSQWSLRGVRDAQVDADALGRVLTNLLRNALEAAPSVRIEMHARMLRGELELIVQDNGPGIASDVADRVFEPFVSTKQRGTGLGLALSARVLSFLGGELELLNPGEPGARFRVRVPVIAAESVSGEVGA